MGAYLSYFSKVFATSSTAIINDKLYVWGGYREGLPFEHESEKKLAFTSFIEEYNLSSFAHTKQPTKGNPPNGVMGFRCCAVKNKIYYFGGRCKTADCYHNNLFALDPDSCTWMEINCDNGPIRKSGCGMISFASGHDQQFILVVGGVGFTPDDGSKFDYVPFHTILTHLCYTNEVHIMCVLSSSSQGHWTIPEVTGDYFMPTAIFSFDYISNSKAILFGGFCIQPALPGKTCASNDVFIVTFSTSPLSVNFEKISKPEDIDVPWPVGRAYHSTTIIHSQSGNGSVKHYLLVLGGIKDGYSANSISDCWIMDIEKLKWKQIPLPEVVTDKFSHSVTSYSRSVDCVWILIAQSGTVSVTELVYSSSLDEWTVANVFNDFAELKSSFRNSLLSNDGVNANEELLSKLEEENRSLKKKIEETNEAIAGWMNDLESIYDEKLLELKKTYEEKTMEKRLKHQEREIQPWIIQPNEIKLTGQEIGSGAYGKVEVAIFRGTKVAAKTLHNIIVSSHNRNIFIREKDISSHVHHPNIVQFIGAIQEENRNFILIYELMTTSLHALLQGDRLSQQQILDVCEDVLSAMCYIHLWKPHPIIHRDISSPNILLEPLADNKWRSKLSDFGSANLQLHVRTAVPGNPSYAAPEADNPRSHSSAMDVYSFGILTAEMILHEAPEINHREREKKCFKIKWTPMKNIVIDCINFNHVERPSSLDLLTSLSELKL